MNDPQTPPPEPEAVSTADDPFFSLIGPSHWNAFVGRQGEERYYVDGYLEAAVELATAVIEKRLSGQRDTLVMPILFTARHGLELSLKSAIRALAACEILREPPPENHDIAALWAVLADTPKCDAHLPRLVAALEPYVRSLSAVDEDGQALRYPVRRDGELSLGDKSLVNLKVVLDSLKTLQKTLEELVFRVDMLADERRSGTGTSVCSRSDLFMIAAQLPQRDNWDSDAFETARTSIREAFRLSSRQFQDALYAIQKHPQMGAMIGLEFDLAHLDDDSAIFAVEVWRRLHPRPAEPAPRGGRLITAREIKLEEIVAARDALAAAAPQLVERLSPDALADLETLYQMGRTSEWPERYPARLAQMKAEHAVQPSRAPTAVYLLGKGNLSDAVAASVTRLGRPRLAEAIRAI